MRIEGIHIRNYRQYSKIDLEFPKKDKDINIIIGKNGVGKTTFLNAINWCLYGDEPHAYSQESSLPIRNLSNQKDPACVELEVSADDGSVITFSRVENESLLVKEKRPSGETKKSRGKNADILVDSFVPEAIRDFFFFDGEQLDRYFIDEKTKNIKDRISMLSHIDILEILDDDLSRKLNGISRKAGAKNKDVETLYNDKEAKENNLKSEKEVLDRSQNNLIKTKNELEEIKDKLQGIPDVEQLEEDRNKALQSKNDALDEISQLEKDRRDLFLIDSPYLFLNSAMQYVLDDISYKKRNDELPKPIDEKIIRESLEDHMCHVCGQHLEGEKWDELNQTLTTYKMSSEQSKKLLDLETLLKVNETKATGYYDKYNNLKNLYKKAQNNYSEKSENFKEIDRQFQMYDDDTIRKNHNKRVQLEKDVEKYENFNSDHKANIILLKREIEDLEKKLNDAMEKDKKTRVYKKKKDFLFEAVELVKSTKEEILENTRKKIEKITRDTFFDLTWKKDTYSDVKINDNYLVELIHSKTNANSLGSASAAERELLVLAFTLGVHSISEFDSPLLIDTPLARVSDDHRTNFANTFIEISKNKQVTLLLTPAEYSEDIQELFNKEDISRYEIVMANDETHSDVEEVK